MEKPERYNPAAIEAKWQARWAEARPFATPDTPRRPKYYCLEMFPYPSGRIHMGHVRNYAIGDVIARFHRMQGYEVLHPMGWDSFGLPAENAAIEKGIHPAVWTAQNIAYMRSQLKRLGCSYDWDREVSTCEEAYYRWNQWFFLKMYERGLAFKRLSPVNWCPHCETVLANEQVLDGCCWRCGSEVGIRELEQWFFRITAYAEELLAGLDRLKGWPERVLTMQRNWIGRSPGLEVNFPIEGRDEALAIFTTRPDTLYGVTFMTLAPEYPDIPRWMEGWREEVAVREFVERVRRQPRHERGMGKEGVFTGLYAINPLNGTRVPIWVANFVLMEYGTGAIMAVPAHDQRDFEFARAHDIPIRIVIQDPEGTLREAVLTAAYVEEAGRLAHSGPFDGLAPLEAKERISDHVEAKGWGRRTVHYRLRDWGISRQRYWGTPIPIVYCDRCGTVPVPVAELPVRLPRDVPFTGRGGSPLLEVKGFVTAKCPRCGGRARRETDTMDTFVDSSWYFLRHLSPRHDTGPFDPATAARWMPVDQYIGGIEHAVLHLLYARFFTMVLRDLGLVREGEPFQYLLTQGMVIKDGAKMSKSRGNVVDPDAMIQRFGADTARLFLLFAAPPEKDLEWSDAGVEGASRFLHRVWKLVTERAERVRWARSIDRGELRGSKDPEVRALRNATHRTIRKVTSDLREGFQFNTAVAALMELYNLLSRFDVRIGKQALPCNDRLAAEGEAVEALILLLHPFAPHLTQELWERIERVGFLTEVPWPEPDPDALAVEEVTIVIQVDGRVRGQVRVPADADEAEVRRRALGEPKIRGWLGSGEPKKVVYVPGRLLNLVVAS